MLFLGIYYAFPSYQLSFTDIEHAFSSLIMCTSPEELQKNANWDGKEGASRQQLLVKLQRNANIA